MKKQFIRELLEVLAKNATCKRLHTSALIIKNGTVVSLGYNGAVRGASSCDEVGCLEIDGHCLRTSHAEENAILNAARNGVSILDSNMYCLHFPCHKCLKMIVNSGIKELIYFNEYNDKVNMLLVNEYKEKGLLNVRKM